MWGVFRLTCSFKKTSITTYNFPRRCDGLFATHSNSPVTNVASLLDHKQQSYQSSQALWYPWCLSSQVNSFGVFSTAAQRRVHLANQTGGTGLPGTKIRLWEAGAISQSRLQIWSCTCWFANAEEIFFVLVGENDECGSCKARQSTKQHIPT